MTEVVHTVATVAALKAVQRSTLANGDMAHIAGYAVADDGGGGLVIWVSASTATEDDGECFEPDNGTGSGRWHRLEIGDPVSRPDLSPAQFGVDWASSADQTAKILAWAAYVTDHLINPNTGPKATSAIDLGTDLLLLKGPGDGYPLLFEGEDAGIAWGYEVGNSWSDHANWRVQDWRFKGDGTQTLLDVGPGARFQMRDMTFEGGLIGARTLNNYGGAGWDNHYTGNASVGLYLDGCTAYTEHMIYARGQDASTGAAVLIAGANTENITIAGGAIEGNHAPAIKVDSTGFTENVFRLTVRDVYFEINGDAAEDVPQFDIPSDIGDAAFVKFEGCKISQNQVGDWITGENHYGKNVIFSHSFISGENFAENASFLPGCSLLGRFNYQLEPTLIHAFIHSTWDGGVNSISGYGFQAPARGKSAAVVFGNTAVAVHPYATASVGTPPTITENTDDDYGDGSWTRIAFQASVGNSSANYALLDANADATAKPFRIYEVLMKSDTTAPFSFIETGTGQALSQEFILTADKIYRMLFIINREIAGANSLRVWPETDDGAILDVIVLSKAFFASQFEASAYLGSIVQR